jgi:hypothetical protein
LAAGHGHKIPAIASWQPISWSSPGDLPIKSAIRKSDKEKPRDPTYLD